MFNDNCDDEAPKNPKLQVDVFQCIIDRLQTILTIVNERFTYNKKLFTNSKKQMDT